MNIPVEAVLEDVALMTSGEYEPSPLLMFAGAGVFTRMAKVSASLEGVRRIRPFADGNPKLPEQDALFTLLKGSGMPFFGDAAKACYALESKLDSSWLNIGDTYEEQCVYRRKVLSELPGLGPKTASMSIYVYLGERCWLVPVDRWHLRRYGLPKEPPGKIERYEAVERLVIEDILSRNLPVQYRWGILAHKLWEEDRQDAGESLSPEYGVKVESHADFSVRRR